VRILGIDPGTIRMGFGVVDETDGEPAFVACGVLTARAKDPIDQRLLKLHAQLSDVLRQYEPDAVAVEEPFVVQAPRRSAMAVGEARAIALLAAAQASRPVAQYTPTKVRATVTDYGGSDKEQTRAMVGLLLGRPFDDVSLDACDALAVAICHQRQSRLGELLAEQESAPPVPSRRPR